MGTSEGVVVTVGGMGNAFQSQAMVQCQYPARRPLQLPFRKGSQAKNCCCVTKV